MSPIKRKLATSTLVLLIITATWLLAGQAYAAERAIWVWGMANDIVMDTAGTGARKDFFDFCAAPRGDPTKAITLAYFCAPHSYNGGTWTIQNTAELRQFLAAADGWGIKVEFLSGDKSWATPDYRARAEDLVKAVIAFNNATANATERFDGIQFDVEPYLLDTKSENDPLDWNYDRTLVWSEYLALLTNCQTETNAQKAVTPNFRFGVAIPWWYTMGSTPGPQEVIDRVDYIAIMDYRVNAANIIAAAQDEIVYANSAGKKVYVGVETGHPADASDFPPSTTFYEEGNAAMETELTLVNSTFAGNASYAGIAIHYYEDLTQQTGKKSLETAYRRLWTASYPGHYPIINIKSPRNTGEVFVKSVNIQWAASDLDGDSLTIDLQYSPNGGTTWTSIATGRPNTGNYLWNTAALPDPPGSDYLIKITATDSSSGHLAGYSVSRAFTVSGAVTTTDITDLRLWNESDTSLRLKWTPPNCTPKYYEIYRSANGASFPLTPTYNNVVTVNKFIDTGLSGTDKYKYQIKAVYGDGSPGNPSNVSNMLMPGDAFLIDYFEDNEGVATEAIWGAGLSAPEFDSTVKEEGNSSLKLSYQYISDWGAILIRKLPVKEDVSPYGVINFFVKSAAPGTGFYLQFREIGAPQADEIWESAYPILIPDTNWREYQIEITKDATRPNYFVRAEGLGNNEIDKHCLGAYALLFKSNTTTATYYIDEIKLATASTAPSLTVPGSSYSFGTLHGSITDRRFKVGPIAVSYYGYSPPWTIRIWTNNSPANGAEPEKAGLKGADGTSYIPLKVWCDNYGPNNHVVGVAPDEENNFFWGGYDFNKDGSKEGLITDGSISEVALGFDVNGDGDASDTGLGTGATPVYEGGCWYRVPEKDEMDPANVYTWRRMTWNSGGRDASLSDPFNIYLAIDLQGKKNQDYQTTTLTVEYMNE